MPLYNVTGKTSQSQWYPADSNDVDFKVDDISPMFIYAGTWGDASISSLGAPPADSAQGSYFNSTFHATETQVYLIKPGFSPPSSELDLRIPAYHLSSTELRFGYMERREIIMWVILRTLRHASC